MKIKSALLLVAGVLLGTVMFNRLIAAVPASGELRVAVVGNPVRQVAWTPQTMERLKAIGFNTVQLNIGWGYRPFGEPLNLADVVTVPGEEELAGTAGRRAELKRRVVLAKKHGFRTIFHFGSPYANYDPNTGKVLIMDDKRLNYKTDDKTEDSWYDILNPKVRGHEIALLREFRREFPEVDDIMVYTYDQHAWQTPEFQYNKFSYGVPLDERLPGYVSDLHKVWTEGRTGKAMWWEPWEISAGQAMRMMAKLPREGFGLMLHSNIGETQLALPVDGWMRTIARLGRELGIPVVAEGFFSSYSEEVEPLSIPAPRLVDQQYLAFTRVPGIVGIKEYYGIDPNPPDFNLDMLQARLRNPGGTTDELINQITERFGQSKTKAGNYLRLLSDAYESYPWEASWLGRQIGRASIDHGWSGATILGPDWTTPAWQSTRHARFMKIGMAQPHFWMLEDVQLRCEMAAELFDQAGNVAAQLIAELASPEDRAQFEQIDRDAGHFRRVARSYALHLRETNVAQMLRQDLEAGRPMTPALVKELGELLDVDVSNQNGKGRVVEMRDAFVKNPEEFVRRHLVPTEVVKMEKGPTSLTTR